MSEFVTKLFTTPSGQGALVFGLAFFLYMGIPKALQKQQIFVRGRDYDRVNSSEMAIAADPRNRAKDGPVSFSQVAHRKPKRN